MEICPNYVPAANSSGLALAGNAYRGVGIPQCIASGERATEQLVPLISGMI